MCEKKSLAEDPVDGQGGFLVGRELDHELSAAERDILLIERVERLLSLLPNVHESRIAQDGEMMGHGGLGHIQLRNHLAHRQPPAAQHVHDLLAGVIGNGFGKEHGIEFHIGVSPIII